MKIFVLKKMEQMAGLTYGGMPAARLDDNNFTI